MEISQVKQLKAANGTTITVECDGEGTPIKVALNASTGDSKAVLELKADELEQIAAMVAQVRNNSDNHKRAWATVCSEHGVIESPTIANGFRCLTCHPPEQLDESKAPIT